MRKHKWLLKENVENAPIDAMWSPALKRGFIADWLKMREMFVKAHPALYLRLHETWDIRYAISRMLSDTAE